MIDTWVPTFSSRISGWDMSGRSGSGERGAGSGEVCAVSEADGKDEPHRAQSTTSPGD